MATRLGMRHLLSLPTLLGCFLLASCQQRTAGLPAAAESRTQVTSAAAPVDQQASPQVRKLVKTVEFDLRVSNTTTSAEELQRLASDLGGYVAEMATQR